MIWTYDKLQLHHRMLSVCSPPKDEGLLAQCWCFKGTGALSSKMWKLRTRKQFNPVVLFLGCTCESPEELCRARGAGGGGGSKKAKPTESESFKGKCYVLKAPQEFGGATRIKNPLRTLLSVTPLLSSEGNTLRLHGALYIKKHSDRSYYPTLILELCTDAWFSQRNGALIWGVLGLWKMKFFFIFFHIKRAYEVNTHLKLNWNLREGY